MNVSGTVTSLSTVDVVTVEDVTAQLYTAGGTSLPPDWSPAYEPVPLRIDGTGLPDRKRATTRDLALSFAFLQAAKHQLHVAPPLGLVVGLHVLSQQPHAADVAEDGVLGALVPRAPFIVDPALGAGEHRLQALLPVLVGVVPGHHPPAVPARHLHVPALLSVLGPVRLHVLGLAGVARVVGAGQAAAHERVFALQDVAAQRVAAHDCLARGVDALDLGQKRAGECNQPRTRVQEKHNPHGGGGGSRGVGSSALSSLAQVFS